MLHYLIMFLISMVPLVELRGSMFYAAGYDLPFYIALPICVVGNMLPVPLIYFFARRVLKWGADKKYIGKVFAFFLVKGERAGQKLVKATGRGGLIVALLLFVGIPIPGTGAWTGTLGASFLNMGFKSTVFAVCMGVILAGIITAIFGTAVFSFFGG